MKRLLLCRHAKSSWAEDGQEDSERPLSARGERDAPRMGERLHQQGLRPDLVVTSPAVRARRTAKLLADALKYPRAQIRLEPALYLADPATLLAVVADQDDDAERLLVVAHNPGLTDLANHLLPELALDNVPTGGIVGIAFDARRWAEVATAPRRLVYYDYPKNPGPPVTAS
jgi:phosphohistidine phosphatase